MSQWKIDNRYPNAPYFLTTTITKHAHVFTRPEFFNVIISSLKHCQAEKSLGLHAFVIMTNHAHFILSAQGESRLSEILRDFKRYTARQIVQMLEGLGPRGEIYLKVFRQAANRPDREYQVWEPDNHPEVILTDDFFFQKLHYIHDNPVRKGYVERPEHWLHSSARNYLLGDHRLIRVDCLQTVEQNKARHRES